jgi:hypothetical protein
MKKLIRDKEEAAFWVAVLLWPVGLLIYVTIMLTGCNSVAWEDDIYNRNNAEYVNEAAWNLGINPSDVTQKQFNLRYLAK